MHLIQSAPLILVLLASALNGCSGGTTGEDPPPAPAFVLHLHLEQVRVRRGDSKPVPIAVTDRDGPRTAPVRVFVEGLPAGVTVDPLELAPGVSSGTLVVRTGSDVPLGVVSADVVATDNVHAQRRTLELTISDPGAPDLSFGNNGVSSLEVDGGWVEALELDGQGRLWVLIAQLEATLLVRFGPEGRPDESFGVGGVVHIEGLLPSALAVFEDRAYVAGTRMEAIGGRRALIAGFDASGTPLSGFGQGSVVLLEAATAEVLLPTTTELTVAGKAGYTIYVSKLDASGALLEQGSSSFNLPGPVAMQAGSSGLFFVDNGNARDGRPVGYLFRAGLNGIADLSFGGAGVARLLGATHRALDVDARERIVVCGAIDSSGASFPLITRWSASGNQDMGFGNNGGLALPRVEGLIGWCDSVHALPDGSIIVALIPFFSGMVEVRWLKQTGAVDPDFANGGVLVLPGQTRFASDAQGVVLGFARGGTLEVRRFHL